MPEFRVGLIGFGHGGAVFHAPLISTTPGLRLAAIATSDPERRERAAREYPDAQLCASADALLNAAALDLVVVASPNRFHLPQAMSALAAGLAVVVDKPLASSVSDAERLRDEARRRGLLLSVFHNRRWDGDCLTVRALMASGVLGDVLRFESRYERWRPTPRQNWREHGDPDDAGGLLYDLGSHIIDQALWLFGPVTDVYAELDRRRPGVAVDDDDFLALRHASGVRSHLWTSNVAAQNGPRLRVLGRRAAYVKWGLDVQEDALRNGERPGAPDWGIEPNARWGLLGVGEDAQPVATEPGAYPRFYEGIAASLGTGAPPPVDPGEAIAVLQIIEAAKRSDDARQVVHLALPSAD
jgi:predicted dehydrogenase